jgi:hypothetical protein
MILMIFFKSNSFKVSADFVEKYARFESIKIFELLYDDSLGYILLQDKALLCLPEIFLKVYS